MFRTFLGRQLTTQQLNFMTIPKPKILQYLHVFHSIFNLIWSPSVQIVKSIVEWFSVVLSVPESKIIGDTFIPTTVIHSKTTPGLVLEIWAM